MAFMTLILKKLKSALKAMARFVRQHTLQVIGWGISLSFVLVGLFFLWAATLQVPDLSSIESRKIEQSVKIYDRTGTVLLYDLNKNARRTIVPLSEISPYIQHATLAIEDPGFYSHYGIQPTAIARAILADIQVILTGTGLTQGGSTITQQVVKGSILTSDRTIARKLKEWVLSIKLERILTKEQIIGLYLNQIPYGGSVYGAEQASETFFGKHASDVTLAEAAYMAAVLPAPTYYSPYGNNKAALDKRKNLVLSKMLEHGYITAQEYTEAKAVQVAFVAPRTSSIHAPHFVFYVQQYLENKYGEDALERGGWSIITTLDADLQVKAEEVVQAKAESNQKNFNASNTGMVALDPNNGQILLMVGSRNYFDKEIDGNFNITLATRQPGSAFKPFAYAKAFEKGYRPDTVVFDVETQFSTNCSPYDYANTDGCYSPVNYDNAFRGPMTLRNALAQSINIPAVKVLYLAGIDDTLRLAKSMGISTLGSADRYGLTLVLGGGEVTLLDMVSAYGVFATGGTRYPTTPVLQIKDRSGNIIEDNSNQNGTQVIDRSVEDKINDVLSDSVARAPLGANSSLQFAGYDVAVKTGTTNDYRDAWTVGYTPSFVLGIWAGNNDNSSMVKKVSGLIVGPMWHDVMQYALGKQPAASFTRSEDTDPTVKPILRGVWQVPGNDGALHEILYWVNKNDPLGPVPSNPAQDPQFNFWDIPVRAWGASHAFGSVVPPSPYPPGGPQTGQ